MVDWLMGIAARPVRGNIHEIGITGYGPADVGPYRELKDHVGPGSGLECHHIVEAEHLAFVLTRFTANDAPAVAIPSDMHRRLVSPRFTAEHNPFGGRRGGKVQLSKAELVELYRQVYTWHTPFRELFTIAQRILA